MMMGGVTRESGSGTAEKTGLMKINRAMEAIGPFLGMREGEAHEFVVRFNLMVACGDVAVLQPKWDGPG